VCTTRLSDPERRVIDRGKSWNLEVESLLGPRFHETWRSQAQDSWRRRGDRVSQWIKWNSSITERMKLSSWTGANRGCQLLPDQWVGAKGDLNFIHKSCWRRSQAWWNQIDDCSMMNSSMAWATLDCISLWLMSLKRTPVTQAVLIRALNMRTYSSRELEITMIQGLQFLLSKTTLG